MEPTAENRLFERAERITRQMEQLNLDAYLRYARDWRKRLIGEFASGVVRGVGFSVGFTLISAMILFFLRNAAIANLPVIGEFVADVIRIVERSL